MSGRYRWFGGGVATLLRLARAGKRGFVWCFPNVKRLGFFVAGFAGFIVTSFEFYDTVPRLIPWMAPTSQPDVPTPQGEGESDGEGTRRAVLVGVDDYAVFPDLKYATADVELIRERLLTLGFAAENIVALTTASGKSDAALLPNLDNIERELAKTLDATGPNDAVFFFFAGHGFQTAEFDGAAPYVGFAPFDAEKKGGGVDFGSTFSLSRFFDRLAEKEARFKWVVVDACREEIAANGVASVGKRRGGLSDESTALGKLTAPAGSVILQSCDEGQFSYEDDELKHGVFTCYLAESLTPQGDMDGDGKIKLLEAVARTTGKTERAKPTQTPYVDVKATDVVLFDGPPASGPIAGPTPPGRGADPSNASKSDDETERARLYQLGRALAFGLDGRKIDQAAGFERLKKATDLGSTDAQAELAELYLNGCVGTKADPDEAFELARDPAEAGNPFGQNVLAICFRDGLSARQDEERSNAYFTDACVGFQTRQNDDVRAATALGERYLNGEGVAKDETAAARLFLKAAEADYVPAMTRLGACFANGVGVEQDFEEATKWFLKAAELNDAVAMLRLGTLYERGSGVALDRAEAAKWYRQAAASGNGDAVSRLIALEEYERREAGNFDAAEPLIDVIAK